MNGAAIIKFLIDNITLLSGILLTGALLKVYLYYKFFGLYIFEFINIGEVLILFIGNLMAYFILLLAIFILILLYHNFTSIWTYSLLSMFTVGLFINFILRKRILLHELIIQVAFLWAAFFLINLIFDQLFVSASTDSGDYLILGTIFISVAFYSIASAYNEYYKVKQKKYYAKTILILKDDEMKSNDRSYYIGKTEKFIFIFHSEEKMVDVIPVSSVKKIIFTH